MKLPGQISISRVNGPDENSIHIEIMDCTSRVRFVDVKLSLEDFAGAITGLAYRDCSLEVRGLSALGKKLETKTVNVQIDDSAPFGDDFVPYMRRLVTPLEVDGWKVDDYDLRRNHHRISREGDKQSMKVMLKRYV